MKDVKSGTFTVDYVILTGQTLSHEGRFILYLLPGMFSDMERVVHQWEEHRTLISNWAHSENSLFTL